MSRHAFSVSIVLFCVAVGSAQGRGIFPSDKKMAIGELRVRAKGRQATAILILGLKNDKHSVPLLREIAAMPTLSDEEAKRVLHVQSLRDPQNQKLIDSRRSEWTKRYWDASFAAKAALMRMKADDYMNDFVVELSTSDFEWKKEIIDSLGYIGDVRAVKYIGPLLMDERVSAVPGQEHSFGRTISNAAVDAMGEILQPPFMDVQKRNPKKTFFFHKEWKEWWQQNREKYR